MARSKRRVLLVATACASTASLLLACSGLIGLDEFTKGECPGAICPGDGSPDVVVPDAGDSSIDSPFGEAGPGAQPVSWAHWHMPGYGDGGTAPPNPPSYTASTADTVSDNVTKLVWQKAVVGGGATFPFDQADAQCKKIVANGPWRAPKRIELVTLLDFSKGAAPFIDTTFFTGVANVKVWTTSEVRDYTGFSSTDPNRAYWTVNFDTGEVAPQKAVGLVATVLCVKGTL